MALNQIVPDSQMTLFANLSALLTGIAPSMLTPDVDPIDIKTVYFSTAQSKAGVTFSQLLETYDQNQTKTPAEIAAILFKDPALRYLCRSIMLMWYLGSWYDPAALQANDPASGGKPGFVPSSVISAAAYTQGWAWSVAQAHPMGYSNFNFGYWSENPPSLADFIGTSEGSGQ
ncbi:MAG: sorbitol dehydrogenase [Acidobacteriota bacterium]|nr:sorbitol dehydrogenase [Acidobacteriota bacterium]